MKECYIQTATCFVIWVAKCLKAGFDVFFYWSPKLGQS